ncbi:MAG TPA: phosphate/phosphite/phosphonate ABC transporter substrate-binding protein [candidate division Zixibacteria bacterium]|nr:phosphate/phosphite/phosphonate ABC transporter substrate-binding protein [candidate division Zixibacteria bacterium]
MKRYRPFAALAVTALFIGACTGPGGSPGESTAASEAGSAAPSESQAAEMPDKLVLGFVPSREAGQLVEDIQPLADFLTEELGIEVEGVVSNDYAGLVTAMQSGQAHMGFLPPYGMVQAVDEAGAEIILQSARFGSTTYHTQFFTNDPDKYCEDEPVENTRMSDDQEVTFLNCNGTDRAFDETPEGPIGIEALANLEPGTTVSFVEQTSASGYIFPATVLISQGIDPMNDIEPVFAGSHDNSVVTVCMGDAEVGVSFDDARTEPVTDCDVASNVVVFAYGPEIPNDGVAVAGDLPDELKQQIKDALLAFAETEEGATVLDEIYNITAFGEPNLDSLEIVRQAAAELGYEG